MKIVGVAIALALALTASYAFAQSRSVYDWQSGNSYIVTPGIGGGAHIRGFNAGTGSMWSTDIDTRGNMHGFDSNNDYWTYNRGTGTYMNLGTGEMCTGHGYGRICTGGDDD
jgi:hypothetical protein